MNARNNRGHITVPWRTPGSTSAPLALYPLSGHVCQRGNSQSNSMWNHESRNDGICAANNVEPCRMPWQSVIYFFALGQSFSQAMDFGVQFSLARTFTTESMLSLGEYWVFFEVPYDVWMQGMLHDVRADSCQWYRWNLALDAFLKYWDDLVIFQTLGTSPVFDYEIRVKRWIYRKYVFSL